MQHQTVNLRARTPARQFGDAASRERYEAEVDAIRDAMTVEFQVAPGATVEIPGGRLGPCDEVRADMWQGLPDVVGWRHLERLVHEGVVIAKRDGRNG